jgi:hypothetical protein
MVRLLWDGGFQLGQSVRTPEECLKYMIDDDVTAAALYEGRYIAGGESLLRRFQTPEPLQEALRRGLRRGRWPSSAARWRAPTERSSSPSRTQGEVCRLRDVQQIRGSRRCAGARRPSTTSPAGELSLRGRSPGVGGLRVYLRCAASHFQNGIRQTSSSGTPAEVAWPGWVGDPPPIRRRAPDEHYRHATGPELRPLLHRDRQPGSRAFSGSATGSSPPSSTRSFRPGRPPAWPRSRPAGPTSWPPTSRASSPPPRANCEVSENLPAGSAEAERSR